MKVAVTAATGQLGSAIINHLIPVLGPEDIIGTSRKPERGHISGIRLFPGDYDSPTDLNSAFNNVEVVLLVSSMSDPMDRVRQHRNVIEAAKSAGVRKIVYTSILPKSGTTGFDPVILSNRQTESDIKNSGLEYAIGRNGIYIQPDLEYIDHYVSQGKITNCAGSGRCAYTSRDELGYAYAQMVTEQALTGEVYNLYGELLTQSQLADDINRVYGTKLVFEDMSVAEYRADRKRELGDFLGTIVAGIYEGIRNGAHEVPSHYEKVTGRPHKSLVTCMEELKLAVV